MSRNLCRTDCRECPGESEHIVLEETPRPIEYGRDVPKTFAPEYDGLVVAEARCVLCGTLYLAWVDWPGGNAFWSRRERRFCDLSYRRAFDDEPTVADLPIYEVEAEVVYRRKPREGHRYLRFGTPEEVAAWEKRKADAVAIGRTVTDDLAAAKASVYS